MQEDENDDGDENDRIAQGVEDFVDGLANKGGGVVDDSILEALGKAPFELLHLGIHTAGGFKAVRTGKLEDGESHGRLAVECAGLVVLLRAELDAGDIAEPDDASSAGLRAAQSARVLAGIGLGGVASGSRGSWVCRDGLEDDVGKLLRIGEPPQRIDCELELLAVGNGLLADLAGGNLEVLLRDGLHDIHGCQAKGREFVGIHPGPHTVVALAEIGHAGDARETTELILELDRRVVTQEDVVVALVWRDQVHDHHRGRRHLADIDSLALDERGDDGQGQRDPVLDEDLGHV